MDAQTRLLIHHFVRGYLTTDLTGGEHKAALSASLLISPGLFLTVILAAKYVTAPFPIPAYSAMGGFADRLLIFGASFVLMALVAVVQWDRLSLGDRDASNLGVLPLRHGVIVRAKWLATAWFATVAALMINGLPSLIYPIVSVGRLDATWGLVLQLTTMQFALALLSGLLGFLLVFTIREGLLALLGSGVFARISAAVQATLVIGGVLAFFLVPPYALGVVRSGSSATTWLPNIVLAGTFEEVTGHRVANLPIPPLHPRVASRAAVMLGEYRRDLDNVRGSTRRLATGAGYLGVALLTALLWNNRRRLEVPVQAARGSQVTRALARVAWRSVAPRPETRAGATFACRTLLRSQPHRLLLSIGIAVGLAAGAIVFFQDPPRGASLADTTVALLSIQGLLVASVAAGVRTALRRTADARAGWLFAVAWNGQRTRYDTGVTLACWFLLSLPVVMLAPLWAARFGADGAVTHAAVGIAVALLLSELLLLSLGTFALVDTASASDAGRALPVLGVPVTIVASTLMATAERWSPGTTIASLLMLAAVLRASRIWRRLDEQPVVATSVEPSVALGLNE